MLTYAIADRDVITPKAINCGHMRSPSRLLTTSRISAERFQAAVDAAFAAWQRAADVTFREASNAELADIVIGEQAEATGYAFSNVVPGNRVHGGFLEISKAAVCLNPARRWKDGRGGDLTTYDLTYTLMHEIGHAIGLDHPGGRGHMMAFRYDENLHGLSPGDVAGAVFVYGARPETLRDVLVPASVRAASPPARTTAR